jgi:hypothetical protein
LIRAYSLIGYKPDRDYKYVEINRTIRAAYPPLLDEIVAGFEAAGGSVARDESSQLLSINGDFTAAVVIVRALTTTRGSLRWRIRLDTGLVPDLTVAVRLDASNSSPLDYYVFPSIDLNITLLKLAEDNAFSLDAYRFDSLEFLYSLAGRCLFGEAA